MLLIDYWKKSRTLTETKQYFNVPPINSTSFQLEIIYPKEFLPENRWHGESKKHIVKSRGVNCEESKTD